MAWNIESRQLTLDQVCSIGKGVLEGFPWFTISTEEGGGEPVHESYAGDVITEPIVRAVTARVLALLAAMPEGTRTASPATLEIGGIKQQSIYRGNVALSFRLQFDDSTLKTVLHVGGYIVKDGLGSPSW
jgi:hypothetical protein